MEQKYYTNERNVQIVIALLKAHGIRKVVVSPGTTNITFVASLMYDGCFELYSSVDERSAAYMACGMAAESGEPVVLSCTGATASRNYMPGLTEAYYRKLPIVAITSHQGTHRIGHLIAQNIDRRVIPADIALQSVTIPAVKDKTDERFCEIEANKALLELRRNGGGPVHINLITTYSRDFSVQTLLPATVIRRYFKYDVLPVIPRNGGHVAVFIGSHKVFSDEETAAIDAFCASHDAVVICDHTSGYKGKYAFHAALVFRQSHCDKNLREIDTLIHIGEVSGDYDGLPYGAKQVWRVSEDGELRDAFGALAAVFQMREIDFFKHYCSSSGKEFTDYYKQCVKQYEDIIARIPDVPFSNIWIAQQMHNCFPKGSQVHLGILNTLRSWNLFTLPDDITTCCNVGGFGIDGLLSSLVGASLVHTNKLYFGIVGDLAFFYDMNVLGNRHIGENIRIMLINNGRGTEFRNYNHPGALFGEAADSFIAAAGHYGNQSKDLVRHYAEDLGFKYLSASNKEEFVAVVNDFMSATIGSKPILFECFTNSQDESDALFAVRGIVTAPEQNEVQKSSIKQKAKKVLASAVGEKGMQVINIIRGK